MLGFPHSSVGKESACIAGDPGSIPGSGRSTGEGISFSYHWIGNPIHWVRKICWRRDTPVFLGFPCGSAGKESACNVGDLGLIPGLGRSPGEEKGYPLQYSGGDSSLDCIVHGVTKSQTQLMAFHFQFLLHVDIFIMLMT